MLTALILAAGDSTRMGRPKALLPDAEGRPFVARIARTFAASGVSNIVIVTGQQHDAIVAASANDPEVTPVFARNPDPSRGQLSSLWTGLDEIGPDTEAVLMTLVDVPLIEESTIRAVIDAWRATGAPIVRPAIGDRHGHPVLFARELFDQLRRAPLSEGAKAVVHSHADRVVNIQVNDEGCLVDVDTKGDYDRLIGRAGPAEPG